jgi:hypothetical protein
MTLRHVVFVLLACALPAPAQAWDAIGHMLISEVAWPRLQPDVQRQLQTLATQLPFPGVTYDPITMGCWMDDLRTERTDVPFHGQFFSWHYIDLGLMPGDPMPSFQVTNPTDEAAGNVVQALTRAVAVMKGGTDPLIPDKVVALGLIMHLVGDIHQPLHCSTYYFPDGYPGEKPKTDAGGNRVEILDTDEEPGRFGPRKLNLHAFWDEAYRAKFQDGKVALDYLPRDADHHDSELALYRLNVATLAPASDVSLQPDFPGWATESNQLSRDHIYGALTFDPRHRETTLTEAYVLASRELARRQLVLAGYRLAELLNGLLGSGGAPKPATP